MVQYGPVEIANTLHGINDHLGQIDNSLIEFDQHFNKINAQIDATNVWVDESNQILQQIEMSVALTAATICNIRVALRNCSYGGATGYVFEPL